MKAAMYIIYILWRTLVAKTPRKKSIALISSALDYDAKKVIDGRHDASVVLKSTDISTVT